MYVTTGYEDKKSRIEIVPLIDMVFLLLCSFIYATRYMTVYRGLRVELPVGAGIAEELKTVIITIAEDNTLWIDDHSVEMDEAVAITASRAAERNTPVLVSGDRRADLGIAVELLSGLKKANVTSVSFQVKEER